MQPEGPNKSEERLQRYAKERRERGGDFSLHPATRRLLQGEVTRQFGTRTKEERTRLTWFGLWRRRLAVGTAFAAVLATGTILWNQQNSKHESMKLADARTSGREDAMARVDDSELRPESTRSIALTASGSAGVPINEPASVRESLPVDGLAGVQLGMKVNVDRLTVAPNAQPATENYFSDFAYASPATNASVQTSRELVENLWAFQLPPASDVQANLSSLTDTGVVLAAPFASPQAGAIAAGAAGRTLYAANTNPAQADNANRFSRLSEAQVALRREQDEAKRASQVSELAKKPLDAGVALNLRPDASETLARAEAPALAAPVASSQNPGKNTAALDNTVAPGTPGAQQRADDRAGLGNRIAPSRGDAGGGQVVFFNQLVTATASEDEVLRSRQLQDLTTKKVEQQKEESQVLSEFTVEQLGNSVRLYDSDGSVYAGEVVAFAETESRAKLDVLKEDSPRDKDAFGVNQEKTKAVAPREANANRGEEFSFNAVGNNVSLQQPVVVNGRFRRNTDTNVPAVTSRGLGGTGISASKQNTPALATAPAPARRNVQRFGGVGVVTNPAIAIEGTVQIGATNVQRFRAVPGEQR